EIPVPLIQKARSALRPFKNSWPIWMVRVIDAITQFLSALSAARDSLLSVNQHAVIDAETFGKGSEIGDKEFSSRKDAFELRLRSRLLRRAVRQKDSPVARPEVSGPTQANVLLDDAGPGASERAKIRITGNGNPILDREWRGPRLLTRDLSDSGR